MLVYWLLNALVSRDLVGNRFMWITLACALVGGSDVRRLRRAKQPPLSPIREFPTESSLDARCTSCSGSAPRSRSCVRTIGTSYLNGHRTPFGMDIPKGIAQTDSGGFVHEMFAHLRSVRPYAQRFYDFGAWVFGYFSMAWLQQVVGYGPADPAACRLVTGLICGLVFVILAAPFRLHEGRSPVGSFADALLVTLVGGTHLAAGARVVSLYTYVVRLSVAVTGPMCAFVVLLGGRAVYRVVRDWALMRGEGARRVDREPVVVIGAGDGAAQLVGDMVRDPSSEWLPVALLDDDPYKRHRRLNGVPVVGPTSELEKVADRYDVRTVILAIPSASAGLVRPFNARARKASLDLKVLPSVNDLSNPAHVQIKDVRDIEVSDFLGRQPIETDVAEIAGYLTGRRVLVTGAGGSIGSELCRQIARFGPAELIMLDRDESALHAVQLSMQGRALLDSDDIELGDIRDERFVLDLFERRRPEVVFHAAALKHLPLLEALRGRR